jgi:hypothetical protein
MRTKHQYIEPMWEGAALLILVTGIFSEVRRVSLNSHVSDLRNLAGMVYAFRNSSGNLRYVGRNPPRLKLSCSLKSRGS